MLVTEEATREVVNANPGKEYELCSYWLPDEQVRVITVSLQEVGEFIPPCYTAIRYKVTSEWIVEYIQSGRDLMEVAERIFPWVGLVRAGWSCMVTESPLFLEVKERRDREVQKQKEEFQEKIAEQREKIARQERSLKYAEWFYGLLNHKRVEFQPFKRGEYNSIQPVGEVATHVPVEGWLFRFKGKNTGLIVHPVYREQRVLWAVSVTPSGYQIPGLFYESGHAKAWAIALAKILPDWSISGGHLRVMAEVEADSLYLEGVEAGIITEDSTHTPQFLSITEKEMDRE